MPLVRIFLYKSVYSPDGQEIPNFCEALSQTPAIFPCSESNSVALGLPVPAQAGILSLQHGVQTGSGAHTASYPMGTRGYFLGGKATGA